MTVRDHISVPHIARGENWSTFNSNAFSGWLATITTIGFDLFYK